MFTPLGIVTNSLGKKLINETLVLDSKTKMPLISIQPKYSDGFLNSVKIKILDIKNTKALTRIIKYQILKFNACRLCKKCESLCPFGAIALSGNKYKIDGVKYKRCRKCVDPKILAGG